MVLAPVLKAEMGLLKEHIDKQFADIFKRLDRFETQLDGLDIHSRERCALIEQQLATHGQRIESQEKQSALRWAATFVSTLLALVGIRSSQ